MPLTRFKLSSIADGGISTAKLADNAVTTAKIDDDAVNSAKIGVDVIAAEDLANNSVTVAELADGAVTEAKIGSGAVTTDKIGDAQVSVGKLASSLDLSSNTVTLPNESVTADKLNVGQIGGRRNIIINGAMQVAQRGTLTGVSLGTNTYLTCDRFQTSGSTTAVVTTTQDSDAPNGFGSSLKIDVTTADASLASTDGVRLITRLEGQDLQQIKKGTADAQPVTLSFWVKSPKTGTHIAELFDVDTSGSRTVSAEYTITSANTWQNVSITFPADTTGAFDNDNQQSLLIIWWLAAGSDFTSGTLQTTWGARTEANRAVGQVNCVDDTANNFYITGVQLEVGTVATPFEHRSYGEELSLCQRYYEVGDFYGYFTTSSSGSFNPDAVYQGQFKVQKRTPPSLTRTNYINLGSATVTTPNNITVHGFTQSIEIAGGGGVGGHDYDWQADAEL